MKKPGCCTLCGDEVYEVKVRWGEGLLHREPRQLGKPTAKAITAHYLLTDGSTTSLTFCEPCLEQALDPETFAKIWRIVLEAFERELSPEYIRAINATPRTEKQQQAVEAFVTKLANEGIVASLGHERADGTI